MEPIDQYDLFLALIEAMDSKKKSETKQIDKIVRRALSERKNRKITDTFCYVTSNELELIKSLVE